MDWKRKIALACLAVSLFAYGGAYSVVRQTAAAENEAVCSVNGTKYVSLTEGISAWTEGSTLTLLADCQTETISVNGKRTLDLGGYVLSGNGKGSVLRVMPEGELTVRDALGNAGKISGGNAQTGGGLCVMGGSVLLYGGTVTGNTASNGGGIFLFDGASLTLAGGSVSGNTATEYGGGVFAYGSTVTMTSGSIEGNSAADNGGGIYLYGVQKKAVFTMTGGTVSENVAAVNGGGVSVWSNAEFMMSGGMLTGNKAQECGGGIYLHSDTIQPLYASAILSAAAVLSGNSAKKGGGAFVEAESTLTVDGAAITENSAQPEGGGVYAAKGASLELEGKAQIGGNKLTAGGNSNAYFAGENAISIAGDFSGLVGISVPQTTVLVRGYAGDGKGISADSEEYRVRKEGDDLVAANIVVVSLAVTSLPDKTQYLVAETFDSAGMEVTATYQDGTKKVISGYVIEGGEALAEGTDHVTVSYTEEGRTVSGIVRISVGKGNSEQTDPGVISEEEEISPAFIASVAVVSAAVIAVILIGFFMNRKKKV